MPPWRHTVSKHPPDGPPGLSTPGANCIVYRGRSGRLLGVLLLVSMRRGSVGYNIHVDPKARRRGIGSKMLMKALEICPELDLVGERYTDRGATFINAFLEKRFFLALTDPSKRE